MRALTLTLKLFALSISCWILDHQHPAYAVNLTCQKYQILGVIRESHPYFKIIVAEGSKSEVTFLVPIRLEPKVLGYLNAPVLAEVEIAQPLNGTQVMIERIQKIKLTSHAVHGTSPSQLLRSKECSQ
jgi:hypothetical protein